MSVVLVAAVAVGSTANAATPVVRTGALKLITKRAATGVQGATFGWNYTAPARGAVPGTITIDVPAGFSAPQIGAPAEPGYLSVTTTCAQFQLAGTAGQPDGSTRVTIASNCATGNSAVVTYGNVTTPETPGSYVFAASFTPVGAAPIPFAAADTITIRVGPLATLAISPPSATIAPGASQAYTVAGFDAFGNALRSALAGTSYKITPDGRCARAVCTATTPGVHTVTATARGISTTAALTVSGSTAASADLAVTQTVSTATPTYYTDVTFTTTVTNTGGPAASAGVIVHVTVPAGLVSPQVTPSGSTTFNPSSGIWTVGGLAPSASATLTISGLAGDVALSARTVTATATSTTTDPNPANNTASVGASSQPAPVAVKITPDPGNAGGFDVSSPGTVSWTASFVNAANPAAPAPIGGYLWTCETASGNPCPPVAALVYSPDTPPVLTFTLSDLQIDSYSLTASFIPRASAENGSNYVQEPASSAGLVFVTTNSGGN